MMKNRVSEETESHVSDTNSLVKKILENAGSDTIERLASINIDERRQSVANIILLARKEGVEADVTSSIPVELLQKNKVAEAIGYMIERGRVGVSFSPDIIRSVFDRAYEQKEMYMSIESPTDFGVLEMKSLQKSLKQMLLAQFDKNEEERVDLFSIVGDFYLLFENLPDVAMSHYYEAIGFGDTTAILRSGEYYLGKGNFELAFSLFEQGLATTGDVLFLEKHIEALFFSGDSDGAKKKYAFLLKEFPEHTTPILRYKGHVENDNDLDELEIIMNSFYLDPSPTDIHKKLVTSGKEYINKRVDELLIATQALGFEEGNLKLRAALVLKRMSYMEKHISIFLDDTYLETYMEDLKASLLGDIDLQGLLLEYFELYPSRVVQEQIIFDDINSHGEHEKSSISSPESFDDILLQRLLYIATRFFEAGNETVMQNIALLGEKYLHSYPDVEKNANRYTQDIEKESRLVREISEEAPYIYYHISRSLDLQYGAYFRRHIQYLARHPYRTRGKIPQILTAIPRAGAFFLIESILSCNERNLDVSECIKNFSLHLIPKEEALFFAQVLFDNSLYNECISYISDIENSFLDAEFLFLITNSLFSAAHIMSIDSLVERLDSVVQKLYKKDSFSMLVHTSLQNKNIDTEDLALLYISSGYIQKLYGRPKKALKKFAQAANIGSIDGHIESAIILRNDPDTKKDALDAYMYVYSLGKEYRKKEVLSEIISLCTQLGDMDLRSRYIQIGLLDGIFDMNDSISLNIQGNDADKYKVLRFMALNEGGLTLYGEENQIIDTYVKDSLSKWDKDIENKHDVKKLLLASYINAFQSDGEGPLSLKKIKDHWLRITRISFTPTEEAVSFICDIYADFIDIPDSLPIDIAEDSTSLLRPTYGEPYANSFDKLANYMHIHALDTYLEYKELMEDAKNQGKTDLIIEYTMDYIAILTITVSLFKRIPGAKPYLDFWQRELDKKQLFIYSIEGGSGFSDISFGNYTYIQ